MPVAGDQTDTASQFDPVHPNFTTTESPFYWLTRVLSGHVQEMDNVLKRIGLDVPRWRVLTTLIEIAPASISALAEHGATRLPTMMKTVQRLEADGLVRMRARKADGRVTDVDILPKGKKLLNIARSEASRVFRRTFDGFDEKTLQSLIAALKRVDANIHMSR
jgi:MarR family transcriptional regulator, organic hydroperoxide resistance regulator